MKSADKTIKVTVSYVKDSDKPCSPILGVKPNDILIKNSTGRRLRAKETDTAGVFMIENIKQPCIIDAINAAKHQIISNNFVPEKIHFSFKLNESKVNEENKEKFTHQIELVAKRLSKRLGSEYKTLTLQLGRINDDIITGKLRLRFTFTKPNGHEN